MNMQLGTRAIFDHALEDATLLPPRNIAKLLSRALKLDQLEQICKDVFNCELVCCDELGRAR
jgi:hypothetical protein